MNHDSSRVGWFEVHDRAMRDPEALLSLFNGVVVISTEFKWDRGVMRYFAWCAQFDLVKSGESTPEYEAAWDKGASFPTWKRKEVPHV